MSDPKVVVALLTWNQKKDTLECLRSLANVRYPNFEIVVVDNGSSDGTAAAVQGEFPSVHVVRNEVNLGCAEGVNCEIRFALQTDTDFLFILGNDTVVHPDVIGEFVTVAVSDPAIGIVSPMVYYYDRPDTIWFGLGGFVNWRKGSFEGFAQNVKDDGSYNTDRDFEVFPGGFTFVRRSILERGIWLDPAYFIYYDDSDWYLRIKRLGYRFAFAPKAKVWHKPSSALGMESPAFYYYRTRNRLLFMRKNARVVDWLFFAPYFVGAFFWHTLYPLARMGKLEHLRASVHGVLDFCRGKFGRWD